VLTNQKLRSLGGGTQRRLPLTSRHTSLTKSTRFT
jgi:hypothetical protein